MDFHISIKQTAETAAAHKQEVPFKILALFLACTRIHNAHSAC